MINSLNVIGERKHMENRFENYTFLILRAAKQIQRIKNYKIEEFGLKAVHVMCLHYLNQNPGGLTSTELVRMTLEDKAAMSRALSVLQEKDFVIYSKNERNGRVYLTEAGRKVAADISLMAADAVDAGGNGVTEEDRAVFYQVLKHITENLNAYIRSETEKRKE